MEVRQVPEQFVNKDASRAHSRGSYNAKPGGPITRESYSRVIFASTEPNRKKTHFNTDCAFLMPSLACTSSSVRERAILKASVLAYRRCVLGSTYGASQPVAAGSSSTCSSRRQSGDRTGGRDRQSVQRTTCRARQEKARGVGTAPLAVLHPFTHRLVLWLPAAGSDSQPLLPSPSQAHL